MYKDLLSEQIANVKIIIIGKGQYSEYNSNWTSNTSLPVVMDPVPNNLWVNWNASQWDLYFLDSDGDYITKFSIRDWNYSKIYNQIVDLL